jgi:hypothetical protein
VVEDLWIGDYKYMVDLHVVFALFAEGSVRAVEHTGEMLMAHG